MPKASKSAQSVQFTIEEVLPEDLSEHEETSSDQEVFFHPKPSTSKKGTSDTKYVYAIHRRANHGLDSE